MNKSIFTRLLCGFLTVLMFVGCMSTAIFAAEVPSAEETTEENAEETKTSLEEIREILDTLSYNDYIASLKDAKKATEAFEINFAQAYVDSKKLDESQEDGKIVIRTEEETHTEFGKAVESIYLPEKGTANFKIDVPADGLYALAFDYYSYLAKATSIERMLYIDGKIPFSEARYLEMPKTWIDVLENEGKFKTDLMDNDIRPPKQQEPAWNTYVFHDSTGFVVNPLQIYLTKGEHIISLEAVREPVVLGNAKFYPYEELPSYEDKLAEYKANGYKDVSKNANLRVEAEFVDYVSDQTIYPLNDRSSPMTYPQDPSKTRLNTLGSDKWKTAGQWIKYTVKPEESGLYEISMRFKQSELEGMYVSRRIYINGEIPFEEASYLEFMYNDSWQQGVLSAKDGTPYKFYFEKG